MLNQSIDLSISRISNFSGSKDEDFSLWFDDLKDTLKRYPISEKEKITILKSKLKGDARYTFEGIQPHAMNSLEKLGKAMETIFGFANDTREWLIKLNETRQKHSEPIQVFAHRISRMVLKAYPETKNPLATNNKISIDYILRGLNNEIGEHVSILKPKTLGNAIEQALRIESKNQIKRRKIQTDRDIPQKTITELNALSQGTHDTCFEKQIEPYKNGSNNRFKQLHEKIYKTVQKDQEIEEKLNALTENQKRLENTNQNHSNKNHNTERFNSNYRTDNRSFVICYHCNKKGHTFRTCFNDTEEDKKRLENNDLKGQGTFSSSQRTRRQT